MAVKIFNVINRGIRIRENGVFTAPELITDAGLYIPEAGGYYVGVNILVDSKEYALIVSPKQSGENSSLAWKATQTVTSNTKSFHNGKSNTQAMVDSGIASHPAAQFCYNLDTNGFNDWHLPSRDELWAMYRTLKPSTFNNQTGTHITAPEGFGYTTQTNPPNSAHTSSDPSVTTISEFTLSGSQKLSATPTWSSTEYIGTGSYPASQYAITVNMSYGNSYISTKTYGYTVRAVRWLEV